MEHPDITSALRTGYPAWQRPPLPTCDRCGAIPDAAFTFERAPSLWRTLCRSCFLEETIQDMQFMSDRALADFAGAEFIEED